jgi:hypothetical protein
MSSYNPKWKINFPDLIKDTYSEKVQRLAVSKAVSDPAFRRIFGNRVIDLITERTQEKNVDKNDKKFPKYSKAYKEADEFSIYGKSADEVNLTLTGEMLSSMRSKSTREEMEIYLTGEDNKNKAQGHISGKYGASKTIKKRDFLGVPDKELKDILKQTVKEFIKTTPREDLNVNIEIGNQNLSIDLNTLDLL